MKRRSFNQLIKNARKRGDLGRKLYREIKKKKNEKTSIIVFPHHDEELNEAGMTYLDTYLKRAMMKEAIVITSDDYVSKNIDIYSSKVSELIITDDETITSLIHLYVLDDSMRDFIIISSVLPEGRKSNLLIESGLFTKEMIVAIAIYFIIPYERIEKPTAHPSNIMIQ